MMTTINATSILASEHSETGDRLDTILVRYPSWLHTEMLAHRPFSCSLAAPAENLIEDVSRDPAVPLFWGKNQRGMQVAEECNAPVFDAMMGAGTVDRTNAWTGAVIQAVSHARAFSKAGYDKQLVDRLLQPFSHVTTLVSATEWDGFFEAHEQPGAEPHMRMLAEAVRKARDEAKVQLLQPGDWHLPFIAGEETQALGFLDTSRDKSNHRDFLSKLKRASVARSANARYKAAEGPEMTFERADAIYAELLRPPLDASFEHVAMVDERLTFSANRQTLWLHFEEHRNFRGFRQLRAMIETAPEPRPRFVIDTAYDEPSFP